MPRKFVLHFPQFFDNVPGRGNREPLIDSLHYESRSMTRIRYDFECNAFNFLYDFGPVGHRCLLPIKL